MFGNLRNRIRNFFLGPDLPALEEEPPAPPAGEAQEAAIRRQQVRTAYRLAEGSYRVCQYPLSHYRAGLWPNTDHFIEGFGHMSEALEFAERENLSLQSRGETDCCVVILARMFVPPSAFGARPAFLPEDEGERRPRRRER